MIIRHLFIRSLLPLGLLFTACTSNPAANPILILATARNFGTFTSEILNAEGFHEFDVDSLTGKNTNLNFLKRFDVVILSESKLTAVQGELLNQYVNGGGHLIAFKPDSLVSHVFGIRNTGRELTDGYISVSDSDVGRGLLPSKLKFHGKADEYQIETAKRIAQLSSSQARWPGVVVNDYGKGKAIAFAYNLPGSIVLTRQGNPESAGKEMDGIVGIRAMDLFTGGWVDSTQNTVNAADEQMRLLSRSIEYLSRDKKPLPRFWYFPDSLKSLVTLTNDGEDSSEPEFTPQFADVDAKGAKMVLYIKETKKVSKEWVTTWRDRGFEMAGHFDDTRQAKKPDWKTMDSVIIDLKLKLKDALGISGINTVVNHWFVWVGNEADGQPNFAAQAKLEALHHIGMDINYAHYDNGSDQGHFLGPMGTEQGNYTGSGLVMKFANVDGTTLDIYQHLNNVYDQQYMEHKDSTGFYGAFKGLLDRSLDHEVYSFISVKAHNNEYHFSKAPLMSMLEYASQKSVPVWTPARLLEFVRAKDQANFKDIRWIHDNLTFTIQSSLSQADGITWFVPLLQGGKKVQKIACNDTPTAFSIRSMKGVDYVWVTIRSGQDYNVFIDYQ